MEPTSVQHIWPIQNGIADIPDDWKTLAVPEIKDIRIIWKEIHERLKNSRQLKNFNNRLAREWAVETGVIEDIFHINKGVTVTLIEQGLHAALFEHGSVDKPVDYVLNILQDHVEALDWVIDRFIIGDSDLTVAAIKELHGLMTRHQDYVASQDSLGRNVQTPFLKGDWKTLSNNVARDGILYHYCPPVQVQSQMETLVKLHEQHRKNDVPPEVQAAWLHHRFTQIHPFQDGNGRVARALASLVFLRAQLFPLVINRDIRLEYIKALEEADAGKLKPLVTIFSRVERERFDQALDVSEDVTSPTQTVDSAIAALEKRLNGNGGEISKDQRQVFTLAKALESECLKRLEIISDKLPVQSSARQSNSNDPDFRAEVIAESGRLGYQANLKAYASWTRLIISGEVTCRLFFMFHGRGYKFAGVMVCAPILEITADNRDPDNFDGRLKSHIPISKSPFEFYYTESPEAVSERFLIWLDEILVLAISQYQKFL